MGLTLRRLRPRLLETGQVSARDVDEVMALTERQGTFCLPNFMVTAWGRKPL
ncbi:hypothetical protein ACQEWB_29655 [Streptomyces sp. CA-249302]|uniref:hypothetical protein n=1 Tax=Streptomyces sp. CA-249302 TaxID=3240058 RepID=UPI003D8BEB2E